MALYVKTNWVDNVIPLSAANMNKIEIMLEALAANAGRFSQMSGGKAFADASGLFTFTTETRDDFSVIDIAGANTKIAIPASLNGKCIHLFAGIANSTGSSQNDYAVQLFKNGVTRQKLHAGNLGSTAYSTPEIVATGDYFELYFTDSANSPSGIAAGTTFGMEVLG